MYALGSEHPLREPCRRLVVAIGDGHLAATTTTDVIQEFAHAYSRRRPRTAAAAHARRYLSLLAPLLSATDVDVEEGLRLFELYDELDAFDAVLASIALANRAEALVSADRAYESVRELHHVAPGTAAFEQLLS